VIGIAFDHPVWLLALAAAPAVLLLERLRRRRLARPRPDATTSSRRGRPDQRQVATWVRAIAVGLLALALAGPRWTVGGRHVDVAFLVDASDSVGAGGQTAAMDWIRVALAARGDDDRAALALFGRDARLEHGLRSDPPAITPAVVVDGSATDLARALRLGAGVLGVVNHRRVVLLTDGAATQGDLDAAAADLDEAGIGFDIVRLDAGTGADVLVEAVRAPTRVREGEAFDVVVTLRNTGSRPAQGVLAVTADGVEVHRSSVTLPPGTVDVVVGQTATSAGQTARYEARLASGASAVAANDVGRAAVRVDGPAKVLVYARADGLGDELAAALRAGGVPTDLATAGDGRLPPLDRLLDYEATVLVDIAAEVLGPDGMQALDSYVRDAGRGLVAVAGEESFGLGGYEGTPLEALLPVFARVTDPQRRPSVAQALVVDTSGSMAACHCRDEGFGMGEFVDGGVVKTDIAKEAIARAIDQLEAQDTVGVLAFNTRSSWVVPLQQLPSQQVIDDGLARINPNGNTDIAQALREAIAGLRDVEARLRHVVLFTDGFMDNLSPVLAAAEEARDAGITVSVVATGEGSFDELRRVAAIGQGRFYPGRNLAAIPEIIALEVMMTARPIVNEGSFLPLIAGLDPATERLEATPPLAGYLATTLKPAARTLLAIGDERDPLLASWQAGLGTAVAWTSDVAPRWSADWLAWDGFGAFWADVVKSTFPPEEDPGVSLSATATAEGVRIGLELATPAPADATATAVLTTPEGDRHEVTLDRVALDRFEAVVDGGQEGVYAVSAALRSGTEVLHRATTTAIRSYSPEYAAVPPDEAALARLVERVGGRVDPEPATVFDRAGLTPGTGARELWPLLGLLALLLAPVDVGLRRLRLERGDWSRLRGRTAAPAPAAPPGTPGVTHDPLAAAAGDGAEETPAQPEAEAGRRRRGPRPRRTPRVAERDAATDSLLAAKRRARGEESPPEPGA
jgi:uncharacterized membrane protein